MPEILMYDKCRHTPEMYCTARSLSSMQPCILMWLICRQLKAISFMPLLFRLFMIEKSTLSMFGLTLRITFSQSWISWHSLKLRFRTFFISPNICAPWFDSRVPRQETVCRFFIFASNSKPESLKFWHKLTSSSTKEWHLCDMRSSDISVSCVKLQSFKVLRELPEGPSKRIRRPTSVIASHRDRFTFCKLCKPPIALTVLSPMFGQSVKVNSVNLCSFFNANGPITSVIFKLWDSFSSVSWRQFCIETNPWFDRLPPFSREMELILPVRVTSSEKASSSRQNRSFSTSVFKCLEPRAKVWSPWVVSWRHPLRFIWRKSRAPRPVDR